MSKSNHTFSGKLRLGKMSDQPRIINSDYNKTYYFDGQVTVFVDIDDTLVFMKYAKDQEDQTIEFKYVGDSNEEIVKLLPHFKHIEMVKQFKARGFTVIAWSAGGSSWAKSVIEALGLTNHFNAVISKPTWYFDDKVSSDFMPESARIHIDNNTGKSLINHKFNSFIKEEPTDEVTKKPEETKE